MSDSEKDLVVDEDAETKSLYSGVLNRASRDRSLLNAKGTSILKSGFVNLIYSYSCKIDVYSNLSTHTHLIPTGDLLEKTPSGRYIDPEKEPVQQSPLQFELLPKGDLGQRIVASGDSGMAPRVFEAFPDDEEEFLEADMVEQVEVALNELGDNLNIDLQGEIGNLLYV